MVRQFILSICVASTLAGSVATATAQDGSGTEHRRRYAERTTLETQAAQAADAAAAPGISPELRETRRAEAFLLKQRLESGDFLVGDRVVVTVIGEPTLSDTVVVRTGTVIELGKLPAISLRGVLRSELQGHLTRELSRYVREPAVSAVPLLRVAVFGHVANPGYMHVPADMLLTDLLMRAGGPVGTADIRKAEVRRGTERLLDARHVQTALADGIALDDLHIRSGDELNVPEKKTTNWTTVMQAAAAVTALVSVAFTLSR